jgi:hypothetical protein
MLVKFYAFIYRTENLGNAYLARENICCVIKTNR